MNKLFTVLVLCICAYTAYCSPVANDSISIIEKEDKGLLQRLLTKFLALEEPTPVNGTDSKSRGKRQAYGPQGGYGRQPPPQQYGGYPQGPGPQGPGPRGPPQIMDGGLGAEFPDFYDFYPNDFLYDYYDWVCSDTNCQLCNILTSECCDPDVNVNCFLPDSCLNNPCLSGGTCIPTRTIDERPDFICACYPGFTGKYCQLTNEFFFPPPPPPMLPPPPQYNYQPQYQPPAYQPPAYQPPAPQYQQQQPAYQQQQPAYQQQQPSYGNNNNNLGPVGQQGPQGPQLGIARLPGPGVGVGVARLPGPSAVVLPGPGPGRGPAGPIPQPIGRLPNTPQRPMAPMPQPLQGRV